MLWTKQPSGGNADSAVLSLGIRGATTFQHGVSEVGASAERVRVILAENFGVDLAYGA
jgi:hypothetical protein